MTSQQNTVCNTCRVRKVKCDRNDPCGNCVDGNIQCIRTASANRVTQKRRRENDLVAAQKSSRQSEFHVSPSPSTHSPSIPQSPSIMEAQDFIRQEISSGKHMPADRLAVLNSAMSFVNHLSRVQKPSDTSFARGTRVLDVLEDITYPSIEVLYWMLRELTGKSIGPHVLDYFKHVSPKSLRSMGLALINRAESSETLLLYSICVNSAAFKFINTVLSENSMGDMGGGMRISAANYLKSIKLAMARIHLLAGPSLVFLQSLLCSAFIAQGSGDLTHCWTFITAACKVCEDLGLGAQVKACLTDSEDDEELYYCYIWCHILDKNYSMMQGRSRFLLDYEGLDSALSSRLSNSMSSLLSTYLHFVPIQAKYISDLHPDKIMNNKSLLIKVESVVQELLERLERVRAQIFELHGSVDSWGGLHAGSELQTIQFSYHSLRTSILRSRQICLPARSYNIDNDCLESARAAMKTLKAIQEQSVTITDVRAHVSYMHWTVLYHPLTPFFVLFCNVVASAIEQDFELLKIVTSQLDGLAVLSPSIAKLQTLFQSFIELCEGLVLEAKRKPSPLSKNAVINSDQAQKVVIVPRTHAQTMEEYFEYPEITEDFVNDQLSLGQSISDSTLIFSQEGTPGLTDPGWGLFDTQPTLDWLDADFSYFDNNQGS